jgi:biotin carboxyl carrier protein
MDRTIKYSIVAGIISVIVVTGCNQAVDNSEKVSRSNIPVTVSPVRINQMVTYMELSATSVFLFKASIKAPVTGYVEDMDINLGDAIAKNQLLFTIKTKEASAIMDDSLNTLKFSGIVNVKAAIAGLISSIEHPEGDYVVEGDQLCQIAIPGSLVFILDVPFELSGSVKLNTLCEIALPDSQVIKGIIKSRLSSMAGTSQTERFIVKLTEPKSLPENLVSKIRIVKESVKTAVSLSKTSILTDETMQSFWVMKLINDSMAVKVDVTIGISEEEYVQITRPVFKTYDLFLTSGNYGLGDTAYVKVLKTTSDEQ